MPLRWHDRDPGAWGPRRQGCELRPLEPPRGPGIGTPGLLSLGVRSSSQNPPLRLFRGRETGQTCRAPARSLGAPSPRPWVPPSGLALKGQPPRTAPPRREVPTHGRAPRSPPAPPAGTILLARTAPPIGARTSAGSRPPTLPFRGAGLRNRTIPSPGTRGCIRTAPPLRRSTRLQISPLLPNRASSRTAQPWLVTPKLTTEVRSETLCPKGAKPESSEAGPRRQRGRDRETGGARERRGRWPSCWVPREERTKTRVVFPRAREEDLGSCIRQEERDEDMDPWVSKMGQPNS